MKVASEDISRSLPARELQERSFAILTGDIISRRANRMPDYATENAALLVLLDACARTPEIIPKVLVSTVLDACGGDSAVLSILEPGTPPVFRWVATSGDFSPYEGITIARDVSPGSLIVDQKTAQLMRYPRERFPGLPANPPIVEALFAPFTLEDKTVGTLWVATHKEDGHFDAECARMLEQLARFAGIAQRLHESNETLRRTQDALREADRRKDAFLAILAHELRNPLAPIRNAAHLLSSPKVRGGDLQWAQSVISRQVAQMSHLLDDLLDISRITQNRIRLKWEMVALTAIVDSAVEAARPLIDHKQHRLSVRIPSEAVTFQADAVRLTQGLTNLLTNAAKYTDPGGRIELTASVDEAVLEFCVKDSGVGIAPEALAGLFQIFSQVEETLGRSDGGLGIGLALTKGLVELHGGTIEAHSEGKGRGSAFVIHIPIRIDATSHVAANAYEAPELRPAQARVLIADDNKDAADSIAILLELAGHEIRVSTNGRDALTLAQTFRPEVAIIDIGMPDIDGYAVARSLRQEPWGAKISLIALTGWGQETDRERATKAGFDHHLTKPVDPARLESFVAELLTKRSSWNRE